MAYGIKYQLISRGKNAVTSKLVISEDGYAGAEIDRNVPVNSFFPRKYSEEAIQGTTLEFYIREESDFEFLPFYTNNPKKYKVDFYQGLPGGVGGALTVDNIIITADNATITADATSTSGSGYARVWTGYINPQQYSCAYKPGKQNIFIQAVDGLGLLKDEDFTLTGNNSELAIIKHCVDKIGFQLGYAIAVEIWEMSHDTSYPPLAQTYRDADLYEEWDCYDVLIDILESYDASITQCNNRWLIMSYKDKKATRMLYTHAGVYEGIDDAPAVLNLSTSAAPGYVRPVNHLVLSLLHGGRKVKITHDYGRKDSFLSNYDFSKFSSLMFTDWTKSGTFVPSRLKVGDRYICLIPTYSNVYSDYIEQVISVANAPGESFVFEVDFCPVGYFWSSSTGSKSSISMQVMMQVMILVGTTLYFLSTTGWSETPGFITQTVSSAVEVALIEWNTLKIITGELPGDGNLIVRLFRYHSAGPPSSNYYYGVAFSDPSVYFLDGGELYDDEFEETAIFDESTEPGKLDDLEINMADAPEVPNASLLYNKVTKLSDGSLTRAWPLGDTEYNKIELLLKMIASRNRQARQVLRGIVKGAELRYDSLVKHAYNDNREFEIVEAVWDVYEAKWDMMLVEWFSFLDQDISYASGGGLTGAADLDVVTVTPASYTIGTSTAFNTTVHVDNTGDANGRGWVQWRIVDTIVDPGPGNIKSSGSVDSGSIAAISDDDIVIAAYTPADEGTYYFQAKMLNDTSWVSSPAITVIDIAVAVLNHIDTIADGKTLTAMTVTFEASVAGGSGWERIYWQILDSFIEVVDYGWEDVYVNTGTDTYNLPNLIYPAIGSNYTLEIGLDGVGWDRTSNLFNSLA